MLCRSNAFANIMECTLFLGAVILLAKQCHATALPTYQKISWTLGPCQLEIMENCDKTNIRFLLYSRMDGDPLEVQLTDTKPPDLDPRSKFKVLIHGYAGLEFNETRLIKDAYLQLGRYNILVVDWGNLVRLPCYIAAVLNTKQAGKCTATMIAKLAKHKRLRISKIHMVGFSLGAHVAAFASNHLKKKMKRKVGRITGLDPALPFFATSANSNKLDKSDASFVDIIHTNIGVLGKVEATGHADFYVNGGFMQPVCPNAPRPHLCSHLIANVYYVLTIFDAASFESTKCGSIINIFVGKCYGNSGIERAVRMGEHCSKKARGVYYAAIRKPLPLSL